MHKTRADAAAAAGALLFLALLAGESALIVDEPHVRSDSAIESGTAVAAATESGTAVIATRAGRIGIASRDSAHWRDVRGASGRDRDIVDHPALTAAKPARPCGVLETRPIFGGFTDMEDPR